MQKKITSTYLTVKSNNDLDRYITIQYNPFKILESKTVF